MCAVVCVVITVTTTVVHMNRLQTLRECVYNARGRSCTCFTGSSLSVQHQAAASAGGFGNPVIDSSPHDQGETNGRTNERSLIVDNVPFLSLSLISLLLCKFCVAAAAVAKVERVDSSSSSSSSSSNQTVEKCQALGGIRKMT